MQSHLESEQPADYSLETSILHLAGVPSDVAQTDVDERDSLKSMTHPFAWQATGLTPERCAAVQDEVERQFEGLMYLIFPGSKTAHPGLRLAIRGQWRERRSLNMLILDQSV